MPSTLHPQAKFDPLPPDLDLDALVEKTNTFDFGTRVTTEQIDELGLAEFEKLVLLHVIIGGKPLVVEGWHKSLPPWVFSTNWLQDNVGKKEETVKDLGNSSQLQMTIGHYLTSMEKLTRQWTPSNFRDPKRQRLYLKDIDCPQQWHASLEKAIPQILFYNNESIGEKGGPGSSAQRSQYGHSTHGRGLAPSGDLMSNLPPEMRAQNMMCYIGHEGTYTPAHREMCATLGHNIMVETSEIEKGEKPGSSIWFMTESKDRQVVSEYFLSMLGHDIEVENHFAQINAWRKAPFPVYVVEQKIGDFILIPPLAPHQVWNRGTRTMKAAWNRTTVETLELALHEALPRARMVCRDEQYKCKAIVYYSLLNYADRLQKVHDYDQTNYTGVLLRSSSRVKQLRKDFKRLLSLYTEILLGETFSRDLPAEKSVELVEFDSNITCSYCRCNIFNRFLTCKTCVGELTDGGEDTYDVCMECYAMGRSCGCLSNLVWVEQWSWSDLVEQHSSWRTLIVTIDGGFETDRSPLRLEAAQDGSAKKSAAQICQEQLKLRPWRDINKAYDADAPPEEMPSESEPEVDDEGRVKKKRKSKGTRTPKGFGVSGGKTASCHICLHREWLWKLATCTACNSSYCYGTLWRAFDLKPQEIMENTEWKCPKCLLICSCGKCRKNEKQISYRPKGTLLGHDTKKVADPRSVESLVDFSRTNLGWLRGEGDDDPKNSQRMKVLKAKAESDKVQDPAMEDDHHISMEQSGASDVIMGDTAVDPMLQDNLRGQIFNGLREARGGNIMFSQPLEDLGAGEGGLQIEVAQDFNGFTAPQASMLSEPESAYPDPSMSRMMGQGYYQQSAEDLNRILFDHPGTTSPNGQQDMTVYPRLEVESGVFMKKSSNKRKKGLSSDENNDSMDQARLEFIKAQKKQKLNNAKKRGNYIMTEHQLEGGSPLVVRLPLPTHKDFLQHLETFDESAIAARHNPRPGRSSTGGLHISPGQSVSLVTSDVQGQSPRKKSIYQELSEDEEFEMFATDTASDSRNPAANKSTPGLTSEDTENLSNVARSQNSSVTVKNKQMRAPHGSLATTKKRGRPSKSSVPERQSSPADVGCLQSPSVEEGLSSPPTFSRLKSPQVSLGAGEPTNQRQLRRSSWLEWKRTQETRRFPEQVLYRKSRKPSSGRRVTFDEAEDLVAETLIEPSVSSSKPQLPQRPSPRHSSPSQDLGISPPYSSPTGSSDEEMDSVEPAVYRPAIRGPPGLIAARAATQISAMPEDDWLQAKLNALRQAEEEVAEEEATKNPAKVIPVTQSTGRLSADERRAVASLAMEAKMGFGRPASALSQAEKKTPIKATSHEPGGKISLSEQDSSSSDDEDEMILSRPPESPIRQGKGRDRGRGRLVPSRGRGMEARSNMM